MGGCLKRLTKVDVKSEIANLNISANTPVEVLQKPFTKDTLEQKLQLFLAD